MRGFDYLEPETLEEACRLKAEFGDDARVMAGATALMLALRQRMLAPGTIISLAKLERLRGIRVDGDGALHIGALTLHAEIAGSEAVRKGWPAIAEMAGILANPQVRNQGTVGGNLCYGDPATDPPACLLAHDARIVVQGTGGSRDLAIEEFLVDYFEVALEEDEIVVEIVVPATTRTIGRHVRFKRTAAEHRPLINLAVTLEKAADGTCGDIRIAVGASTPVPVRLTVIEDRLRGNAVTAALIEEAVGAALGDLEIIDDQRGSEDYRRAMIAVVARRTLSSLFDLTTE